MSTVFYWFVQLTWGLLLNIVGGIIALSLIGLGYKPKRFGHAIYFEIGNKWGGLNLGGFFIVQKDASEYTKCHEYGHSIQNMMFGVFMPFVITIPSIIRYQYRKFKRTKGHSLPPYYDFWCEGWATSLGKIYYTKWSNNRMMDSVRRH